MKNNKMNVDLKTMNLKTLPKYIVFKSYFLIAMNGKLTSTRAKSIGADCSKMSGRP